MNPYLLVYLVGAVVTFVVAARYPYYTTYDESDQRLAAVAAALAWPILLLFRLARVGKGGGR